MALSPRVKKWLKWTGLSLLGLLLLVVLILGGAIGALHTQWGRDKVATLVQDLADSPDMHIELGNLASVMPWDLRLGHLALADSQGVWLEADELAVSVDLWPLLDGAIAVNWVTADKLAYLRAPVSTQPAPESTEPVSLQIPKIPPVRLDELRVDRLLYAFPPAEGEAEGVTKAYRVGGSIKPEDGDFVLDLAVVELPDTMVTGDTNTPAPEDFRPDKVKLLARLDQEAGNLSVDVSVAEGSGGLIASSLGLAPGTSVSGGLKGSGPLKDWAGDLKFDIGGQSLLDGRVTLALDRIEDKDKLHVGLTGDLADVANLVPPDVAGITGSTARLDLALLLDDLTGAPAVTIESLALATPTLGLHVAGALVDENVTAAVKFDVKDASLLQKLSGGALHGAPVVHLDIEANQEKAVANLDAGLGALALPQLSSDAARLTAKLEAAHPMDDAKRVLDLTGQLLVEGLQPPEGVALDPHLATDFVVHMEEQTRLTVRSLHVDNGENTITAKGDVDLEALQVDAHLAASLPNAGALFMLHPLNAAVNLEADAAGSMEKGINVSLSGDVDKLQGLDPQLAALVGEHVALTAKADIDEKMVVLDSLEVDSLTDLRAKGRYGLQDGSVDAALDVTPPDDLALPGEAGDAVQLAGLEPLQLTVKGDLQRLDVTAGVMAAAVDLPDRSFHDLKLQLDAGIPLTPPAEQAAADSFALTVNTREADVALSSKYHLEPQRLALSSIDLTAPGVKMTGSVDLDLETTLAQGGIKLVADRLASVGALAGVDMAGSLTADVSLSKDAGTQGAVLKASGTNLAFADATVESLQLRFESGNVMGLADGSGNAKVALQTGKAGTPDAFASNVKLDASMGKKIVQIVLDVTGQAFKPFDLKLQAALQPFDDVFSMNLSSLKGTFAGLPIALRKPVDVSLPGGGVKLSELALGVDDALIAAQGAWGPENADLTAQIKNFRLAILEQIDPEAMASLPEGIIDLDVRVQGPMAAPKINAKLLATKLELPDVEEGADLELPALDFDATVAFASSKLTLDALLTDAIDEKAAPLLKVNSSLPMKLALEPFDFALEENAPLEGTVEGRIQLAMVQRMLGMTDQVLGGKALLDASIGGRLNDVDVDGKLAVKNGSYENLKIGTALIDLEVEVVAKGEKVSITKLTASDGLGGKLNGKGSLALEGDNPFSVNITLTSFTPMHQDIFTGILSGEINVDGDTKQGAKVDGDMTVDEAELVLPQGLPPSVVVVPVEQKNVKGQEPQEKEEEKPESAAFPVDLNMHISIPARFYVSGHGLESEWQGDLKVTGDANDPRIVGTLDVKRGTFDFLDKKFEIEEGNLTFTGASPPSPTIRVVTATQAADIIARVIVQGTPENLNISFSSEPYLPQNEILAAVLFGRRLDSLTPMQAVRLASAVNQLSGGGGGSSFNVIDDVKDALGVDELTAGEGKSGGTTLEAGKYITDDVYLKGSKGLDPRDDNVSVEVQITPNLGLESEMGADSSGGLGVNWRYDY